MVPAVEHYLSRADHPKVLVVFTRTALDCRCRRQVFRILRQNRKGGCGVGVSENANPHNVRNKRGRRERRPGPSRIFIRLTCHHRIGITAAPAPCRQPEFNVFLILIILEVPVLGHPLSGSGRRRQIPVASSEYQFCRFSGSSGRVAACSTTAHSRPKCLCVPSNRIPGGCPRNDEDLRLRTTAPFDRFAPVPASFPRQHS